MSNRVRAALAAAALCLGAAGWLGGRSLAGPATLQGTDRPPVTGVVSADPSKPEAAPAGRAATVAPAGPLPRPAERSQVREAVAQRIDALHRRLKIVPAEQALWDQFADTMLRNALDSEGRFRARQAQPVVGAAEGLDARAQGAQARADMLAHLSASFRALYEAMPPDQRLLADQVFRQAQRQEGRHGPAGMPQD